jgi:type VI secretion system protein ImpK
MSMTTRNKRIFNTQDLDALLQGTYLLVVELRHGASVQDSPDLWRRCENQVEEVQQRLNDAGVTTRSVELISHAQCALLDETVLSVAKGEAHAKWASESLQARFFSRHQAGEFLYEDMRESLRQPSPDLLVLTIFQRVLMLGFKGRYRDINDPERGQLLDELNTQVMPFELDKTLKTKSIGQRMHPLRSMRAPLVHILAAGLLLIAIWWGLDHWLSGVITTLAPGQA